MEKPEKDPITGQYTTGHSWDGIKELRTPVPMWWLYVWFASIAIAMLYAANFQSFATASRAAAGFLHNSARGDLAVEQANAAASQASYLTALSAASVGDISANPDLARYAFSGGKAAFAVNCIACHGAGGAGQIGQFPSLIDDDWIWGGTIEDVYQTAKHGIRNATDPDARFSTMPSFADLLSPQEIDQVADYVLALRPRMDGSQVETQGLPGAAIFTANCESCHQAGGTGGRDAGAPRLNDAIWLYGSSKQAIVSQITHPRGGVMPAFGARLSDETIKMLAFYVHGLGGGEPSPAAP